MNNAHSNNQPTILRDGHKHTPHSRPHQRHRPPATKSPNNHRKSKTKADFIEGELHALAKVGSFLVRTKNKANNLKSPGEIKALFKYSAGRLERLLEELRANNPVDRTGILVNKDSRMRDIACFFYATSVRLCIIDIQKRWGILLVNDTGPSWGNMERRVEELVSEYDGAEVV